MCSIGETDEQAQAMLSERMKALFSEDVLSSALVGSPETIRQRLATFEAAGVQELVIHFADVTHLETIRRFGRRVPLERTTSIGFREPGGLLSIAKTCSTERDRTGNLPVADAGSWATLPGDIDSYQCLW